MTEEDEAFNEIEQRAKQSMWRKRHEQATMSTNPYRDQVIEEVAQHVPVQQCRACFGMGFVDGKGDQCLTCNGTGEQPPQRTEQEPDDIASILACQNMLDAQPVPEVDRVIWPERTEQEPVGMRTLD